MVYEVIPLLVKLLVDLFTNPVTAKNFFFMNDLKVLVDVIMREVTDTSDPQAGFLCNVLFSDIADFRFFSCVTVGRKVS